MAIADDFRPASLTIAWQTEDTYQVTLKVPVKQQRMPLFTVIFDKDTEQISQPAQRVQGASHIQVWQISRPQGLAGLSLMVDGLRGSNYDVILRFISPSGALHSGILNTETIHYQVPDTLDPSAIAVAGNYLILGFEHILIGLDHLLFVLALILMIKSVRNLIWTITFFTLAHSLTLAAVTLNWFSLPARAVEAIIALSIVFLAREMVFIHRNKPSITAQYPWLVSLSFGLLHGMGFAGALAQIGIPENEVVLALLAFNIGVEFGQLFFIGVVLTALYFIRKMPNALLASGKMIPAYTIGTVASIWLIQRLVIL
ncbi:HupE/UreJ family protein [Thalassotalea litorea]|uniref:HupE/UreJ family protein n=1 Tax=Thalassotalea litorea TaxID=2020715 RepID=A0A5R9IR86_9GAMM|nr:HupE/UreJ family protein [Thalassotalea litorea]TLU67119.1 HupE/UreJ family protein [Thalassotalea litorea]